MEDGWQSSAHGPGRMQRTAGFRLKEDSVELSPSRQWTMTTERQQQRPDLSGIEESEREWKGHHERGMGGGG